MHLTVAESCEERPDRVVVAGLAELIGEVFDLAVAGRTDEAHDQLFDDRARGPVPNIGSHRSSPSSPRAGRTSARGEVGRKNGSVRDVAALAAMGVYSDDLEATHPVVGEMGHDVDADARSQTCQRFR